MLAANIQEKIALLYGSEKSEAITADIMALMEEWREKMPSYQPWVDENTSYLITYGDSIRREGEPTLATMKEFADKYLKDTVSNIHILPMFPYTSDDGFSVVDYCKVDPNLGEGLVVPHGKSVAVKEPVFAAAFIKKGDLMWSGLDGDEPVEMVFLLAIPPADAGSTHIAILTELSSTLVDEDFRNLLKMAKSPEMVLKLLSGEYDPAEFIEPAPIVAEQPLQTDEAEETGTNKAYGTVLLTGCAIVAFLFTLM